MCNYPGPMMVSIGDSVPEETWNRIKLQCALNLYGRMIPVVQEGVRGVGNAFSAMAKAVRSVDFGPVAKKLESLKIPYNVDESLHMRGFDINSDMIEYDGIPPIDMDDYIFDEGYSYSDIDGIRGDTHA
ncbi:gp058 [Rhodococcus phage ReqiPoco6]|uniref:Gp058 n=1 Tax=Rhodococcus phage ReqiPoco6 TaxID=691964 RepID=D4P7S6_9CAUD|nr:gp058 [Rhodococcus phage ReqiPoco6]ADD81056.1 gp058 [Rhodococcus phage ReqiPoco6]